MHRKCLHRKSRRAVGSYIVLLDRKEKRERGSRRNGCFGKKKEEGRRGEKNVEKVDNKK